MKVVKIMNYIDLMNYIISELGELSINLESSDILKKIINNEKKEFYTLFESKAWNYENLNLLLEKTTNENDISFLKKIDLNLSDEEKKKFIIDLMKRNYYTFLIDRFPNTIKTDNELMSIFILDIKKMNINIKSLEEFLKNKNDNRQLIISSLLKEERYELVALLLVSFEKNLNNSAIIKEDLPLLNGHINKIAKYVSAFNLKLPIRMFKNNFDLFFEFFLNGCYNIIECIQYMGYEELKKSINSNIQIINKIIEYVAFADDQFLKSCTYLSNIKNNANFLKILLVQKKYEWLDYLDLSAWTLENQLLYFNLKNSDDVPSIGKVKSLPYLSYKYYYDFGKPYIQSKNYSNIKDNNSLKDFNICMQIGLDISNNKLVDDNILMNFYKFIFETKSKNIHKLVLALTEENINNINKLFNEFGITDYFKEHLLFDPDYIKYCGEKISNELQSIEYANYIKMLSLDEKMQEYIYPLCITKDNIKEYFDEKTVTRKYIDKVFKLRNLNGIKSLVVLISNNYQLTLNEVEKNIIEKSLNITSDKQKELFLDHCLKRIDYLNNNQVDNIYQLFLKVVNSNSFEIRKQSDKILEKLINFDNYMEMYTNLENILTDGSSPEFIKRFAIYKLLYGDKEIIKDNSVTSPILKSVSREEADKIILNDLLKISLATNSRNIKNYIKIMEKGNDLYSKLKQNNINLDPETSNLLHDYRIRLEFICKYFFKLEYDSVSDDYSTIHNIEKNYYKTKYSQLSFPDNFSIPLNQFIFSEIFSSFGSVELLKFYMSKHEILKVIFEESNKVHNLPLMIKKGDFIKGIDSDYLDNIFNYGSLSIEFLGENSNEDMTHLDTDMSLIDKDINSIPELLKENLTGCTWEDMNLILSSDYINQINEFVITKDKDGIKDFEEKDKTKLEIFCYSETNKHWCIRTGFPITYVKAIIASKNYDRAKLIVLKNDFFVPIYDRAGNLIFSFEDYYREKRKMDGLSYYDCNKYTISENLETPEILEITKQLKNNKEDTDNKRKIIYQKLNEVFSKYFDGTKYHINSSLEQGVIEIIDTGSTGRNTNLMKDGDFDFIIRLDQNFINSEEFNNFSRDIYNLFNKPVGDSKIIRLENVKIEGLDEPLKLDLTIINKNNKIDYSTEMCINDRLNTIKNSNPDKYPLVLANILFAKNFFKDLGAYKKYEGGFGGVGIENFILQHGGSFYDAAFEFVQTANQCVNLNQFKQKFHIYDFGKNYYTYNNEQKTNFPYDDFIFSLNDNSYPKIVDALKNYIDLYEKENNLTIDKKH